MRRYLVAGATGRIGRHLVDLLSERGAWIRSLSRSPRRAQSLSPYVNDIWTTDATVRENLHGVCSHVDVIISALGVTTGDMLRDRRSFANVDLAANRNLIQEALQSEVETFVYVSVYADERARDRYVGAHRQVEQALREADMSHRIVRPTGLFDTFRSVLQAARWRVLPVIGSGNAKTNPVHERDVAELCLEVLDDEDFEEIAIGGPQILSRREIADMAADAVKKTPVLRGIPAFVPRWASAVATPIHPRFAEMVRFLTDVLTMDYVAPQRGSRMLGPYFRNLASR